MAMCTIVRRGIYKVFRMYCEMQDEVREKNVATMRDRSARRPAEERKPRGTEAQTLDEHS